MSQKACIKAHSRVGSSSQNGNNMSGLFPRPSWSLRSRVALALLWFGLGHACAQKDPLPSWNNGPAKQAIVRFVKDTTDKHSASYVAPEDRIATFDQDGTLWTGPFLWVGDVCLRSRG
jgi:hypothetical protein